MKKILLVLLVFTFYFQTQPGIAQENKENTEEFLPVTIQEVVSDPKEYNGVKVTLEGVVKKVKYTKSSKGEDFTVFKLKDAQDEVVNVYYEDQHLPIEKGDVVRISGKFSKEKKYLLYKIKNVIKARTVDAVTTAP